MARAVRVRSVRWDGFDRKAAGRRRFVRRFLAGLLAVVLVGAAATGGVWLSAKHRADTAYGRFDEAIGVADYAAALSVYRDVQERSLRDASIFSFTDTYKESLNRMEGILESRVTALYDALPTEGGLPAASLALLDGMQEIASMLLSRLARASCEAYLGGSGDIDAISSVLAQLRDVPAAASAMQGLLDEIPALVEARPAVVAADEALAGQRWLEAATGYLALADGSAGFLHDVSLARLEACRAGMREPVLARIAVLMDGSRYYTALDELGTLDRVMPGDAEVADLIAQCEVKTAAELEVWTGPIEYVAIRPLIADPAEAFDGDSYAQAAADAMLTTYEFRRILEQLLARDYILVDLPSLFGFPTVDGQVTATRRTLRIPKGKKPIVLGLEGLNYYVVRRSTGNSISLSLSADGHVVSTYPSGGALRTDADGEAIGILESFLAEHPEFSFNGARGTISLTGYECVFGAIVDADELDDRNAALLANGESSLAMTEAEIAASRKDVAAVIRSLEDHGWSFASSTYGGIDVSAASADRLRTDTAKWAAQVEPLTGPVGILVYPNGSWIPNADKRMPILKEAGFRIFCGIGATPYLNVGRDSVFIDRVPLNGYTLAHAAQYGLARFLDAVQVLDPARP